MCAKLEREREGERKRIVSSCFVSTEKKHRKIQTPRPSEEKRVQNFFLSLSLFFFFRHVLVHRSGNSCCCPAAPPQQHIPSLLHLHRPGRRRDGLSERPIHLCRRRRRRRQIGSFSAAVGARLPRIRDFSAPAPSPRPSQSLPSRVRRIEPVFVVDCRRSIVVVAIAIAVTFFALRALSFVRPPQQHLPFSRVQEPGRSFVVDGDPSLEWKRIRAQIEKTHEKAKQNHSMATPAA